MILAALILAATPGPCADRSHCPTLAELRQAFARYDWDREWQLNAEANPPGSESFVSIVVNPVRRITRYRCDRPQGEARSIACRVTLLRYPRRVSVEQVDLVRGPEGWKIVDKAAA